MLIQHVLTLIQHVLIPVLSPLSAFSKNFQSLSALFSAEFSSLGSVASSSLGISLKMACRQKQGRLTYSRIFALFFMEPEMDVNSARVESSRSTFMSAPNSSFNLDHTSTSWVSVDRTATSCCGGLDQLTCSFIICHKHMINTLAASLRPTGSKRYWIKETLDQRDTGSASEAFYLSTDSHCITAKTMTKKVDSELHSHLLPAESLFVYLFKLKPFFLTSLISVLTCSFLATDN